MNLDTAAAIGQHSSIGVKQLPFQLPLESFSPLGNNPSPAKGTTNRPLHSSGESDRTNYASPQTQSASHPLPRDEAGPNKYLPFNPAKFSINSVRTIEAPNKIQPFREQSVLKKAEGAPHQTIFTSNVFRDWRSAGSLTAFVSTRSKSLGRFQSNSFVR